jgi:hypothetical protein
MSPVLISLARGPNPQKIAFNRGQGLSPEATYQKIHRFIFALGYSYTAWMAYFIDKAKGQIKNMFPF